MSFIAFAAIYYAVCVLLFALVQKPLFGLYNCGTCPRSIKPSDVFDVYRHGLVSDCIIAAYLTAIPLILGCVAECVPTFPVRAFLLGYNLLISLSLALICVSDTLLYRFWSSKLDASVFAYLRSFRGAFASVSAGYIVAGLLAVIIVGTAFFCALQMAATLPLTNLHIPGLWGFILSPIVAIIALAVLFAIIRGLKIRPNNPSVVYFSAIPFFNHWALNPAYSLIYSLGTRDEFEGAFRAMPEDECREVMEALFPKNMASSESLLNTSRPNILLVVWESLGAEFVESLGGRKGVMPNFERLAEEGVLFTDCVASSFRTDRGLPAIICGLPGQPTTSIIRYTRKLQNLTALPASLRAEGYETTAVHGGELTIMHKSDFYLASGHNRIISQKSLPKGLPTGKWGIHDGAVMDWLYNDIRRLTAEGRRWFTTFQTLSSHEPFDQPYSRLDDEVDNSFAYVDDAFGRFVDRLKASPAWKDLLIVVVADHGYNRSGTPLSRRKYAHIPVLLLGGALKAPRRIDKLMCQTDIAATLLAQLGIELPAGDFPFSRDVLSPDYRTPSALHSFNNGFMFVDSTGFTVHDNVADSDTEAPDHMRSRRGKAILQALYSYLDKL